MPVRIPTDRRGRNIDGKFPSRKSSRVVAFESLIEHGLISVREHDPDVVSYSGTHQIGGYDACQNAH